jgi:phosphoglycolate phosphatase-like HAD superfamily hydrolase
MRRATAARVWAFDVDGCLVDSVTGTSLRPLARPVLEELRAQGSTVVLWSAGGGEYARRRAVALGIDDLVHAFYDKDERGDDGRYLITHLAEEHRPDVCVDDQPEELPTHVDPVAVSPYLAPNAHDVGLATLLARLGS